MKYIIIVVGILLVIAVGIWVYAHPKSTQTKIASPSPHISQSQAEIPLTTVVAENLDTPWAIALLPDNSMLVTERAGRVRFVSSIGELDPTPIATLPRVKEIGEGGLLGIALHPDFASNHFVYLYYTFTNKGDDTLNRVVRMTYTDQKLHDEKVILDNIPGASNHNGGRIKFGPDTFLYIGTGDAQEPSQAQNKTSLAGKILRVTDTGAPAPGNPFGNEVYSLGHRNVQGLAWSSDGFLWATEHGRSGITSGYDELNRIEPGKNYGWPDIEGDETQVGIVSPIKHSGATTTWAPSGAAFIGNRLFFSGLRGKGLYAASISTSTVTDVKKYFDNEFGRIREVIASPDGMLYISTSNQDGRGIPGDNDDKIIKVNPQKL